MEWPTNHHPSGLSKCPGELDRSMKLMHGVMVILAQRDQVVIMLLAHAFIRVVVQMDVLSRPAGPTLLEVVSVVSDLSALPC